MTDVLERTDELRETALDEKVVCELDSEQHKPLICSIDAVAVWSACWLPKKDMLICENLASWVRAFIDFQITCGICHEFCNRYRPI